jgi:methyl-accepting chemotaxis protein
MPNYQKNKVFYMTIKTKLLRIIALSITIISMIIIFILGQEINSMNKHTTENFIKDAHIQKEKDLQSSVDIVFNILQDYHKRSNNTNEETMKKEALNIIKNIRYGKSGYFWINDTNSIMVMHPINPSLNGKDLTNSVDAKGVKFNSKMVEVCNKNGAGIVKYHWTKPNSSKPEPKYSYVKLFKPWGWIIGTGDYINDVEEKILNHEKQSKEHIESIVLKVSILSIVLLIISIITVIYIINKSITKPLSDTIIKLSNSSTQIQSASQNLSHGAIDLSNMSASQSASVEQITATVEHTSQNAALNTDNMERLVLFGKEMETNSKTGYEHMVELKNSMNDIASSSKEINSLVNTIDEIAFQTNLLALNAAVEAARAGEHGVGFAVVADEVRNLSQRSTNEAVKIHDVIEKSVSQAENGLSIADKTNNSFETILKNIHESSLVREETTIASKEQQVATKQLSIAMTEIDSVTQNLSANSEEIAASSEQLKEQVSTTNDIVKELSKMV